MVLQNLKWSVSCKSRWSRCCLGLPPFCCWWQNGRVSGWSICQAEGQKIVRSDKFVSSNNSKTRESSSRGKNLVNSNLNFPKILDFLSMIWRQICWYIFYAHLSQNFGDFFFISTCVGWRIKYLFQLHRVPGLSGLTITICSSRKIVTWEGENQAYMEVRGGKQKKKSHNKRESETPEIKIIFA